MLYILTALFCEAKPYIEIYQLKRASAPGGIQLFEGVNCRLAVSGAGPVNAAAAAAYLLTRYTAGRTDIFINDIFINIGAAGSKVFNIGEIILCHKIINAFTNKALYPEMLYKHPFREGILCSAGRPASDSSYELTDMEGAFAYEAVQTFLPSSQIHCIKVISDNLCPGSVTAESIGKLMSDTAEPIRGWLDTLTEPEEPIDILTAEENSLMDIVSKNLRLTFAMNQKLRQNCRQAKIRGLNIVHILLEASKAKSTEKNEGKAMFAKLISRLSYFYCVFR